MTDLINYKVDSLDVKIFDNAENDPSQQQENKALNHYVDIITLANLLTSSSEIDYQIVSDFFLTYRSFISQPSLLKLLFLKFQWCLDQLNDNSHEHKQNIGKLSLVRTFVVIRHWLLNYFADDFIPSPELRMTFINYINSIKHNDIFVQRIIGTIKRHWTYCCNKSWDEDVNPEDYVTLEIKIGPQKTSAKAKRLSTFALNQQRDPVTRNSLILSTFDKTAIHKLPIPIPNKQMKPAPKSFLNPKNSNLRLSKAVLTSGNANDLYISLTSPTSTSSMSTIRGATDFPKDSKLTKFIPPTPVKKMEVQIQMPHIQKPQPKGLKPLIENWLKTFHLHNAKHKSKDNEHVEKFMRSVVSVARPDNEQLAKLTTDKFDILSARTIDELEYLVKFHNELLNKHGTRIGSTNNSFSFTIDDPSRDNLGGSNIDNMNICECISNINKSVLSFQHKAVSGNDDNKSYISYDSDASKHLGKDDEEIGNSEDTNGLIKKKNGIENLREFNFETENVNADPTVRPVSILSESTIPMESSEGEVSQTNMPTEINGDHDVSTSQTKELVSDAEEKAVMENSSCETIDDPSALAVQPVENTDESNEVVAPDSTVENAGEEAKETVTEDDTVPKDRVEEASEVGEKNEEKDNQNNEDNEALKVEEIQKELVSDEASEVSEEIPDPSSPMVNEDEDKTQESSDPEVIKAEDIVTPKRPTSSDSMNTESDYEEIESFVSTYEEIEDADELEVTEPNANEQIEPATPPLTDGIISSTPHTSPIKSINETGNHLKHRSVVFSSSTENKLDLNRVPTFTRTDSHEKHFSYLSKRSNKSYISYDSTKSRREMDISSNSIFSNVKKNNQLVMVHESHSVNEDTDLHEAKQKLMQQDESSIRLVESADFAIPYPGVDNDAIAELAAISDESFQSDPINAALLKLEGTYAKKSYSSSIDSKELQRQVQDLDVKSARGTSVTTEQQRRKTKLFSLTPVKQKPISIQSSSKILLELLINHKITNDVLAISNNTHHISFILNFDSQTLAHQFTLIEKDCLLEIDWKELIELKWQFDSIVPINSWLELLIQNQTIQGIDLCISRFNLTVNWIISEILLTKDITLRKLTIQRFIHIAQNCYMLQNYSTLMEILLALGSDKIMKLKKTWRIIEPGDILIYKNLEQISSPLKNFANLRNELNNLKPSKGCVPFLGLYLSDLIFNKEKNSIKNQLINFSKFRTDAKIVKSLIQCVQWSTLYKLDLADEVLSKCLYIKALDEDEMNECLKDIE